MTTILTRLYPDPSAAQAAAASLLDNALDEDMIQIITAGTAGGAAAAMKAARVSPIAAAAYDRAMTGEQALLVVDAPFNPIGTARTAMKVLRRHPAINVGLDDEDAYLREDPGSQVSANIMTGHQLLMSNPFRRLSHGHIFGNNPILPSTVRTSAIRGGAHMSRMFWPTKLISAQKARTSASRGGFLISSLFGLPLITRSWSTRDLPTILR